MATTYTGLLQLPKHDTTDPFDITLINNMADLVDAGVAKAYRGKAAHNLLDNSDFRNPVNQRGQMNYTTPDYFIDRWIALNDTYSFVVGDGYATLTGVSGQGWIEQRVPEKSKYIGKSLTVAVGLTNGQVVIASNVISNAGVCISTASNGVYLLLETGANETTMRYRIVVDSGVSVNMLWAALYEGAYTADTLPEYQPKGYAVEILACQELLLSMPSDPFANGYTIGAGGSALLTVQTPTPMRDVNPTLDLQGGALYVRCDGADYPASDIYVYGKHGCFISFMVKADGLPAMRACSSYVSNVTNGSVYINCEL